MAIKAKLFVDGGNPLGYNLITCEYEFNKKIDDNGKPCAYSRGGLIDFSFQTQDAADDIKFHEWVINKNERKGGRVEFDLSGGGKSKPKSLVFKYAHCIHLNEKFDSQKDSQMITSIKISAAIISFGGLEYKNNELLSE